MHGVTRRKLTRAVAARTQRRWYVPSPDGDGARIAMDPRLDVCTESVRKALQQRESLFLV